MFDFLVSYLIGVMIIIFSLTVIVKCMRIIFNFVDYIIIRTYTVGLVCYRIIRELLK